MKLIALCGAAGAGKDTVADMLPARKLAFADTLYAEAAAAWGVEQHVLRCRDTKEVRTENLCLSYCYEVAFVRFVVERYLTGTSSAFLDWSRSPRQILQWWGDYRRAQDPDYFVNALASEYYRYGDDADPTVITDVRFPNEAAMVRQLGGQIWQIRRPGYEAGGTGHASDNDGSAFGPDRVIRNDGGVEDLRATVLAAWEGV